MRNQITPLCYKNLKEHGRQVAILVRSALLFAVFASLVIPLPQVLAQSKPVVAARSPLCSRDNALDMIKQQIGITKTFKDTLRRIPVLTRAADLLWPYEQDRARTVFAEAFELASQSEEENAHRGTNSVLLWLRVPDQRYVVIRAIAGRDTAWAKELTQQMLKAVTDSEVSSTKSSFENDLTAARLLDSAYQLMKVDSSAALDLARVSLNYPASFLLTRFLYRLAEANQSAADQFYAQALTVYGDKPMRQFLYLQAYPFAWRETLNTPVFSFHEVPTNFVTSQSLQRRLVQVMLRRAQQALEAPLDERDSYRTSHDTPMPGTVHLLEGVVRLEPQVRDSLPDLLAPLTQAREKILVSLSVETQKQLLQPGREISSTPVQTFDERIESAQKVTDVDERDELIASAVMVATDKDENLAAVIQAIDKISESNLRAHLLESLYFRRATTAIKDKQFEEAERLATRVEGQEQRAYLHTEIAKILLNKNDAKTHAQEVLDEAIAEAKKAGMTIFAARTLLTASTLYAKIDPSRSIEILADAIKCINHLESPDFSSDDQSLEKKLKRRGRSGEYKGNYLFWFYMPGLDPERAFREMAQLDFDTSLSQTSALNDKFQRAMSTLALADVCLEQARQQSKEKPKKSVKP